jgi:glycine cleavage system aminomethyltransferase T
MGYIDTAHAMPGAVVTVPIRGKNIPATVVKVPFLQK